MHIHQISISTVAATSCDRVLCLQRRGHFMGGLSMWLSQLDESLSIQLQRLRRSNVGTKSWTAVVPCMDCVSFSRLGYRCPLIGPCHGHCSCTFCMSVSGSAQGSAYLPTLLAGAGHSSRCLCSKAVLFYTAQQTCASRILCRCRRIQVGILYDLCPVLLRYAALAVASPLQSGVMVCFLT